MKRVIKITGTLVVLTILGITFQNCAKQNLNLNANSTEASGDSSEVRKFNDMQSLAATTTAARQFKILWHLGPNSEALANATEANKQIENIRSKVDGYYFLVLNPASLIALWPERPLKCRLNFSSIENMDQTYPEAAPHRVKIDGAYYTYADKEDCAIQFTDYKKRIWEAYRVAARASGEQPILNYNDYTTKLHEDSLKRVLSNLKIQSEQASGKIIMSEMILIGENGNGNGDFSYDSVTDKITLLEKPKSFGFLASSGIRADRVMTYQEHSKQVLSDNLLRVPLLPGGDTTYTEADIGVRPCLFCLPNNMRMLGLLSKAFETKGLRTPQMAINVRAWSSDFEKIKRLSTTHSFRDFGGINIEGAEKKMDKASYATTVKGVAWMLTNTNYTVSLLTPGSLDFSDEQTNLQINRDKYSIENLITYVRSFDEDLSAAMALPAGQHAICDPRISIIVGGYGSPMHMEPLPLIRRDANGNRIGPAGTTGMQILVLERFRARRCQPRNLSQPSLSAAAEVEATINEAVQEIP